MSVSGCKIQCNAMATRKSVHSLYKTHCPQAVEAVASKRCAALVVSSPMMAMKVNQLKRLPILGLF